MSQDDKDLFFAEMKGVKPLQTDKQRPVTQPLDALTAKQRQASAQNQKSKDGNYLTEGEVDMLDPYYILDFKRPGIQHGVFRKLKQGHYACEARLDLHRMTVAQARREVFDFIRQAESLDLRSLTIVHGKGQHSGDKGALIKSYVAAWLPEIESVQAFHSAKPADGGVGAVYVLLRKSEKSKTANRIRYRKGREDSQ